MLRIGAPLFFMDDQYDPEFMANEHIRQGYRATFFPWSKTMSDLKYIHKLRDIFAEKDIVWAEVSAWKNITCDDPVMRKESFDFVCEQLTIADEINARCCLCFSGSVDADPSYKAWTINPRNLTEDFFTFIIERIRLVLDVVKPKRTCLTLEMMPCVFPNTPDSYLRMIKAVDHPAFKVHLDPVNLICSPETYFDTTKVIKECFAKLAPWIVSCHGKDIIWKRERGFQLHETIPGTGIFDFRTYISELKKLNDVPLLLEHMSNNEEYVRGYEYVRSVENKLGE